MIRTPAFIGIRYSQARGGNRFLSFMTWVSLLGLTLGVVVLIVVVSVMNGFDSELKRRILGAVPHVVVTGIEADELRQIPGVVAISRFSSHSALLIHGSDSQLVGLYGVDPSQEVAMSIIPQQMLKGRVADLDKYTNGIVLGRPLAYRLGLVEGNNVTVLLPVVDEGRGESIRTVVMNATLVGTFELDSELDYHLGLMNVTTLQVALGSVTESYRLRVDDIFSAPLISRNILQMYTAGDVSVADWSQEYGDFFRTVKMEKIMMFLLLTLIVGIAAFSIVSSLSMLVKEKQFDIAVLKTCGLSSGGVTLIFVIQGAVIGVVGITLGAIIGIPLALHVTEVVSYLESLFGARMLAGTYFDSIPSDVRIMDIVIILIVSLVIALVATIYPAYRAAGVRPAEILRYE